MTQCGRFLTGHGKVLASCEAHGQMTLQGMINVLTDQSQTYPAPGGYSRQGFKMIVDFCLRAEHIATHPSGHKQITESAAQITRSHDAWCHEFSPLLTRYKGALTSEVLVVHMLTVLCLCNRSLEAFRAGDLDSWQALGEDIKRKLKARVSLTLCPCSRSEMFALQDNPSCLFSVLSTRQSSTSLSLALMVQSWVYRLLPSSCKSQPQRCLLWQKRCTAAGLMQPSQVHVTCHQP